MKKLFNPEKDSKIRDSNYDTIKEIWNKYDGLKDKKCCYNYNDLEWSTTHYL